jgi:oxalate decarboxylase/phosphoglucose isomerase-like protein (cupin superfamily)
MDQRLLDPRPQQPEHDESRVVFFPDRVFHHRVLAASRSPRYDHTVIDVRDTADITAMWAELTLDGEPCASVLRLEYGGRRLREACGERGRSPGDTVRAELATGAEPNRPVTVTLHRDRGLDLYAVELWTTLEPPPGRRHDVRVLELMGRDAPVTRVAGRPDLHTAERLLVAFTEVPARRPGGQPVDDPVRDDNYVRSHQEPRTPQPSDPANTVADQRYVLDRRRAFLLDATAVEPVRYRNAMLADDDPERRDDNITEMRWLVQQELGGTIVFFHEVTIPPGGIEGTHQHTGTEELYHVVAGEGVLYVGADGLAGAGADDRPVIERRVLGVGPRPCREVPVKAGSTLLTKSGGIHGIRNTGTAPLRFVAFLYHTS